MPVVAVAEQRFVIVERVQPFRATPAKFVALGVEHGGIQKTNPLIFVIDVALVIINSDLAMIYCVSVVGINPQHFATKTVILKYSSSCLESGQPLPFGGKHHAVTGCGHGNGAIRVEANFQFLFFRN